MAENAPLPDDDWDMAAARAKLAPKHDSSKKARQTRQKRIAKAVDRSARDGRSLRSTGRTAQFNFKALPELKPAAQRAAERAGMTLAEMDGNGRARGFGRENRCVACLG